MALLFRHWQVAGSEMIRCAILLIPLLFVSGESLSQTNLQQRIAAADSLLVADDDSPKFDLVRNTAAETRRVKQNPRYVGSERVNSQGLLRGYSRGLKMPGKPYWTSERMLQMAFFDGDRVYLENQRIYNIKANVIGWIGNVLNDEGTKIGSVRFEIYDQNKVHGHFNIPGKFRLEIEPVAGTDEHDVMEFGHQAAPNVLNDTPDTRTPAERAAAKKAWQERLADPQYDELRRIRDEQIRQYLEAEKAKNKE
jgi:hypothetical protein